MNNCGIIDEFNKLISERTQEIKPIHTLPPVDQPNFEKTKCDPEFTLDDWLILNQTVEERNKLFNNELKPIGRIFFQQTVSSKLTTLVPIDQLNTTDSEWIKTNQLNGTSLVEFNKPNTSVQVPPADLNMVVKFSEPKRRKGPPPPTIYFTI